MRRLHNYIKNRKYLNRIYLLLITAFLVMLTSFALTTYSREEKFVLDNEYKTNQKVLYQIKYNIDYMNEMIRSLSSYIYFNENTTELMYNNSKDLYEPLMQFQRYHFNFPDFIPYISSIYVYNNINKYYYTTNQGILEDEHLFDDIINLYGTLPKFKLISRKIKDTSKTNSNSDTYVFSCFLYNSLDKNNHMNGGLVINTDTDWLFNCIKEINKLEATDQDQILILGSKGEFIESVSTNDSFKQTLKNLYASHISQNPTSENNYGSFIEKIENKKCIITYLIVQNADWVLLKVQPYDLVYKYISYYQMTFVVITLVFILISILVSISISKGIYKPIGNLVNKINQVQSETNKIINSEDEFTYISKAYTKSINQIKGYKIEKDQRNEIMKTYFLRNLISDSHSIALKDFEEAGSEYNITLNPDSPFVIIILKIDNYQNCDEKNIQKNTQSDKMEVIRLIYGAFSERCNFEAVDMKTNHIVILINKNENRDDYSNWIIEQIKEFQVKAHDTLNISISATISDTINSVSEISNQYNITLDNSMYKYILGRTSIITTDIVKYNIENNKFNYPFSLEKKLIEELKLGNIQNATESLLKAFKEISKLNYNNIMLSILHMVNSIKKSLEELDEIKFIAVKIDNDLLMQYAYETETMDDLYHKIMGLFEKLENNKSRNILYERHTILVDTIKKIAFANLSDSAFGLQQLADILKMSTAHIGRIFKENTQISFSEYLTRLRLNISLELLKDTSLNIQQIIKRVGIENETYFYRIFKKNFGTTPREYMLKKAQEEI